ncbi:hypothetical protein DL93DRAFT_2084941 [Clavulina sp. PMI_390]|nr:hypothetical protein DL93DRAFT_2084941 [Clavulina sp. PMI_390]
MAAQEVNLKVLALINEERNGYGLRSNEYAKYHAHCSHKVQRLRQKLKLTHGKGREFKKVAPVSAEALTNEHLQLSLFEAERAWTHSHEISSAPDISEEGNGALRHASTARFRRAVSHSSTLLSQARSILSTTKNISPTTLLEIHAYHLTLQGRFYLRRDAFAEALPLLALAAYLLSPAALNENPNSSREEALYGTFADEIAPQIRYAAHSLGVKNAYDTGAVVQAVVLGAAGKDAASSALLKEHVPNFNDLLEGMRKERASEAGSSQRRGMLREVQWEGAPVPIRVPELVDAFLKVQAAEDVLVKGEESGDAPKSKGGKGARSKVASYDAVLLALADAESVAQTLAEAKELSGSSESQAPAPGAQGGPARDIHFVLAYTSYRLLARRIERDLLLVDSLLATPTPQTKSPATGKGKEQQEDPRINPGLVKLYDAILQSLEQMRNLSVVDESVELVPSVEGRLAFSRAKRVFHLARTYATLTRYAEALSLTAKASLYLREARSIISTTTTFSSSTTSPEESHYPITADTLTAFEESLAKEEQKMKMAWYTLNGGAIPGTPEADAKFKKPSFLDVAFNYIELPQDRLLARAGKSVPGSAAPSGPPSPVISKAKPNAPPSPVASKNPSLPGEGGGGKRRAKVEDQVPGPEPVPEPKIVSSGGGLTGGLSGILGGWWGKK